MVYCSECGKKLKECSDFCDNCGKKISKKNNDDLSGNIEDFARKTADNIERNAERFGKKIERYGKKMEERFDKSTKSFENWHDRYFGIIGPLIGSFIGLIILRVIIELMALDPTGFPVMAKTSELLYPYQLIFFGLFLLSSYTNYFSRKYKLFKLVSPILSTFGFIAGIWILSTVYTDLFNAFDNFPDFTFISNFIINNIIIIFIVILFFAYIVNIGMLFSYFEKTEKKDDEIEK